MERNVKKISISFKNESDNFELQMLSKNLKRTNYIKQKTERNTKNTQLALKL